MKATRARAKLSLVTRYKLFAESAGICQNPDCLEPLFPDQPKSSIHLGELAHIIAASSKGPRAKKESTHLDRARPENIILLCPTCHRKIDKNEIEYPATLLKGWKAKHKNAIAKAFKIKRFSGRQGVRKALDQLFRQNRTIFQMYGPPNDEWHNPEGEIPRIWRSKIQHSIIPNNRRILAIIDANRHLMTGEEADRLEEFRQHVEGLEARHLGESADPSPQFPMEIVSIFKN